MTLHTEKEKKKEDVVYEVSGRSRTQAITGAVPDNKTDEGRVVLNEPYPERFPAAMRK